jgi:phosphopentomutase
MGGIILETPFPVYPHGFPADLIHTYETTIGRKTLGNYPASGTEIIKELGEEHIKTGRPIIYTSADSVFQVAAHEEIIPIEELYQMCEVARKLLQGKHGVGRVIARPFVGQPGNFSRTERRRDFSLEPPEDTILDVLKANGKDVIGVGKIEDIFAHRGLTASNHTGNNLAGINAIKELLDTNFDGLVFANLVDFDALYGHRNDPYGYAHALEEVDKRLPDIIANLREYDVLMITADHGNDPTTPGTDHSRERVPILILGKSIKPDLNLGTRESFTDIAATIADFCQVPWKRNGKSFVRKISIA